MLTVYNIKSFDGFERAVLEAQGDVSVSFGDSERLSLTDNFSAMTFLRNMNIGSTGMQIHANACDMSTLIPCLL